MGGYDPAAGRARLMERRALVQGNLDAWRKQVAALDRPATPLLVEAMAQARAELDVLDRELLLAPSSSS
jgi:hypothetical protein